MAELERREPLVDLARPERSVPGPYPVRLAALPRCGKLMLRGEVEVATRAGGLLGCPLPELLASAEADGRVVLGLGPDAWLILRPAGDEGLEDRLREALAGLHHAVVEVGDRLTAIVVEGVQARTALAAGCALDLHKNAFPPGRVVRTLLAKVPVILWRPGTDDRFELLVDGSLAPYLWRFLENAALEHGLRVQR